MAKNFLSRIFSRQGRMTPRYRVSGFTLCFVKSDKFPEHIAMYLGDISTSGLSFYSTFPSLQVRDSVDVFLLKDIQSLEIKARIVSQNRFYPSGLEHSQDILYRYSIQFSLRLSQEWVDRFTDRGWS